VNNYISEIEIRNFKPHKHLILNLTPGLNSILAHSDRGKSAIISACRWLISNKPDGLAFKNWNSKDGEVVSVKWTFNNGDSVTREKSEDIDRYQLYINGKERVYDSLNRKVPEEVESFLNLDYYNVKTQFSPFFLLQETPGEVGRKFNEIVGLDEIDPVTKKAKGFVTEAKSEYEKAEKEIKRLNQEIIELSYIDKLKKDIDRLEKDNEEHLNRYKEYESVVNIVDNYIYKIRDDCQHDEYILTLEEDVDSLINMIDDYNDKSENIEGYKDLIDEIGELQKEIDSSENIIESEAEIDTLVKLEESKWGRLAQLSEIDDLTDEIGELEEDIDIYEKLVKYENEINEVIKLNQELLDRQDKHENCYDLAGDIQKLYVDVLFFSNLLGDCEDKYEEIIQKGGICPTCKTKLTEKQLREIEL